MIIDDVEPSSPRLRGCFWCGAKLDADGYVFPAPAGVFLRASTFFKSLHSLPRACGGVSEFKYRSCLCNASSPRLRGCFQSKFRQSSVDGVFPAPAGVFPREGSGGTLKRGLPRACGGVSAESYRLMLESRSSPRLRGCFLRPALHLPERGVFPAPAGVFPARRICASCPFSLPRACGGVSAPDF